MRNEFNSSAEQAMYYLLEKGFDVKGTLKGDKKTHTLICCTWTEKTLTKEWYK